MKILSLVTQLVSDATIDTTIWYIIFILLLVVLILILYICGVFKTKPRQKTADELENEELASQAKEMLKGFPKE